MWKMMAKSRVFRVWAMAAFVLLFAGGSALAALESAGEQFVIRGLVFETEAGLVLAGEDETIYLLEGLDMEPYIESVVDVVGTVDENEHGDPVLHVAYVTEEDGAGDAPEAPSAEDPNRPAQ